MERRKSTPTKSSPLPDDYLALVREVFSTNFDDGLKRLTAAHPGKVHFEATGGIYADEVMLCISLLQEGQLAATTIHASCDFDPKASSPTVQDLLAACVDGVGALFEQLFAPDKVAQLAETSLSALEGVPYEWTAVDLDRFRVFLKVDKSNPSLDQLTEKWLAEHDPEAGEAEEEEQRETEKLFVTGPSSRGGRKPTVH
jgi:hypothetical protein